MKLIREVPPTMPRHETRSEKMKEGHWWATNWKREGNPYFGDAARPGNNKGGEVGTFLPPNEGKDRIISSLGEKYDKEKRSMESLQEELGRVLAAHQCVAPNFPTPSHSGWDYRMDGVSAQRNGCNMMTQTINMYPPTDDRTRPMPMGMTRESENLRSGAQEDVRADERY